VAPILILLNNIFKKETTMALTNAGTRLKRFFAMLGINAFDYAQNHSTANRVGTIKDELPNLILPAITNFTHGTNSTDNINVYWDAVTGSTVYKLEVNTTGKFPKRNSTYAYSNATRGTSGSPINLTGLAPSTTYYVKLSALNADGALSTSTITTSTIGDPTTDATSLSFTSVGATSVTINWTSGNGAKRLILAKAGSAVNAIPVDGTVYTGSNTFGSGNQIGTGNYVVYNSTGASFTMSGLTTATTYYIAIFEYNGTTTPLYKTDSPLTGSQLTS
jgi:hypothetical protein